MCEHTEFFIQILYAEMRISDVFIVVGDPRCLVLLGHYQRGVRLWRNKTQLMGLITPNKNGGESERSEKNIKVSFYFHLWVFRVRDGYTDNVI